jgi:hypothetical protein
VRDDDTEKYYLDKKCRGLPVVYLPLIVDYMEKKMIVNKYRGLPVVYHLKLAF